MFRRTFPHGSMRPCSVCAGAMSVGVCMMDEECTLQQLRAAEMCALCERSTTECANGSDVCTEAVEILVAFMHDLHAELGTTAFLRCFPQSPAKEYSWPPTPSAVKARIFQMCKSGTDKSRYTRVWDMMAGRRRPRAHASPRARSRESPAPGRHTSTPHGGVRQQAEGLEGGVPEELARTAI